MRNICFCKVSEVWLSCLQYLHTLCMRSTPGSGRWLRIASISSGVSNTACVAIVGTEMRSCLQRDETVVEWRWTLKHSAAPMKVLPIFLRSHLVVISGKLIGLTKTSFFISMWSDSPSQSTEAKYRMSQNMSLKPAESTFRSTS